MGDQLTVTCPGCGKSGNVPAEYAGRKLKCPGCGGRLLAPAPEPAVVFTPAPEPLPVTQPVAPVMPPERKRIPWWGWTLIVIGVLIVLGNLGEGAGNTSSVPTQSAGEPAASPPPSAPAPAPLPSDRLAARVEYRDGSIIIRNDEPWDWVGAKVELNGHGFSSGYEYRVRRIGAGSYASVPITSFTESDGTRYNPYTLKLLQATIHVERKKVDGFYLGEFPG